MTQSVYNALLNSNAVVEFDVAGNILWANDNFLALLEYKLAEVVGKHHSMFVSELADYETEYREMWSKFAEGQSFSGEFKRISKSGRILWIQGSYTPVRNAKGDVAKIIKLAVDITDKHKLAEDLARKNKELLSSATKAKAATQAKSVFLANMSHEIRTPLNSIIGITDTLAETALDDQQASFIEILQRANNQLMTIINDILDLSKVEVGEIELKSVPFELQSLFEELNSVLGFRAKEKGLNLKITADENVPRFLVGDPERLRQVLMNLINNAIKFTHSGEVHLNVCNNTTAHPGTLLFKVSDTGIGIAKSKFKDIFKPFIQADSTTTRRYGGTGLGLSITKNIVELMQGQLWLESAERVGSTFYFTVTMAPTTEKKAQLQSLLPGHYRLNDLQQTLAPNRLRILVVDDVDDNRNLFGIYLRNTIHSVSFAQSGREAVEISHNEQFDIIFMDVQMPGMDGHEATRLIRKIEQQNKRTPAHIVACTANAFSEDVLKSLQAGCDKHLSKPIRKDTLIQAINHVSNPQQPIAY
ncbi:MAG: response regulator [Bdellovibrio sp.]|nr:response regulator [Bdellovibrio sp.]